MYDDCSPETSVHAGGQVSDAKERVAFKQHDSRFRIEAAGEMIVARISPAKRWGNRAGKEMRRSPVVDSEKLEN